MIRNIDGRLSNVFYNFPCFCRALGIPATEYVMEGRFPVLKLGGLSLPQDSPARETLSLLRKDGWDVASLACFSGPLAPSSLTVFLSLSLVEAALERMMDRCRSGSPEVSAEGLLPLLGLTDKQEAVRVCSLYSKVVFFFIIISGFALIPQALFNIFFSLQDETVDLRQVYFSVAALSGLVSFKSLLHTAFPVRTSPWVVVFF